MEKNQYLSRKLSEDIIFVTTGLKDMKSLYVKRMKTVQEQAREQSISVAEFFAKKIKDGIGNRPPLQFLTKQFYVQLIWRKKKKRLR